MLQTTATAHGPHCHMLQATTCQVLHVAYCSLRDYIYFILYKLLEGISESFRIIPTLYVTVVSYNKQSALSQLDM